MTSFGCRLGVALLGLGPLLVLLSLPPAEAQPANAPPGTICVTPQSWCKAVQPGPPGAPCACPTATGGWIQGMLR